MLFLEFDDVKAMHVVLINRYGGSHGTRDEKLLESAINQARSGFAGTFLHEDVYHMAAAYLYHIVKNHPFVDGNKRTAAAAAITFLKINDADVLISEHKLFKLAIEIATSKITKEQIALFFRKHVKMH